MLKDYTKYLNLPNFSLAATYCKETGPKRGGACIIIRQGHAWKEIDFVAKLSNTNVI